MRRVRRLVAVLLVLAAAPVAALDTIYLVRHAEKLEGWPQEADPFWPLSDAGERRAEALVARFEETGIAAVYTSKTTRAIATGLPIASAHKVPLKVEEASTVKEQMPAFLAGLRQRHAGDRAVLVIGHANTLPDLLAALGATAGCRQRLGIVAAQGMDLIEGFDGLWKVELAKPGCEGMSREVVAASP